LLPQHKDHYAQVRNVSIPDSINAADTLTVKYDAEIGGTCDHWLGSVRDIGPGVAKLAERVRTDLSPSPSNTVCGTSLLMKLTTVLIPPPRSDDYVVVILQQGASVEHHVHARR